MYGGGGRGRKGSSAHLLLINCSQICSCRSVVFHRKCVLCSWGNEVEYTVCWRSLVGVGVGGQLFFE